MDMASEENASELRKWYNAKSNTEEGGREMGHDFSKDMNPPESGWDGIADVKIYPDGSKWVVCPFCRKRTLKVLPETKISMLPYRCKGSSCKSNFIINIIS